MKIQSKFFVWSVGLIVVVAMFGLFSVMTLVGLVAGSLRLLGELTAQGQREAARHPSQTPDTSPAAARS